MSSIGDRAKGAVMGALIGDALGLGPHWYYDLKELREEYGEWISNYQQVKKNKRFPAVWKARKNLKLGDVSQTGQVFTMLLESIAKSSNYVEEDFTDRLDVLLETLDGTPSGGRYTDEAMRDVWRQRKLGVEWPYAGSFKDTAEAAIRTPVLSAYYYNDRRKVFSSLISNVALTHCDPVVLGQSVSFGMHIWMLINGIKLDEISSYAGKHRGEFSIPYNAAVDYHNAEYKGQLMRHEVSLVDPMGRPSSIYRAANDPELQIEPASAVCGLYTLDCRIGHLLPAAYYLAARFENSFELAVLSAINGGGNNMARAALTGALSGAMVGLRGIPKRFVTGLSDYEYILSLIDKITSN